jgi:hypothetical protein
LGSLIAGAGEGKTAGGRKVRGSSSSGKEKRKKKSWGDKSKKRNDT